MERGEMYQPQTSLTSSLGDDPIDEWSVGLSEFLEEHGLRETEVKDMKHRKFKGEH